MIGHCTRPRRQQDFLLPSMPQREDVDENCLYLEQCVLRARLHNLNLEEERGVKPNLLSHKLFFCFFFSFFVSKKVGSGVKAESHRKNSDFSMELGAVCMKMVAVSATYPRPDHCKKQRREICMLELEVKSVMTGTCLKTKNAEKKIHFHLGSSFWFT